MRLWRLPKVRSLTNKLLSLLLVTAMIIGVAGVTMPQAVSASDHGHGDEDDDLIGRAFVLDSSTGRVTYFDLPFHERAGQFESTGLSGAIASPDGQHLVVTSRNDHTVSLYSTGLIVEPHGDHMHVHGIEARQQRSMLSGLKPAHTSVLPDGRVAIANDGEDTVLVIDPASGVGIKFPAGAVHASIAVSTDPLTLWASDYEHGVVEAIDMKSLTRKVAVPIGPRPHGAAYSARFGTVYFASDDGIYEIGARGDYFGYSLRHLPITTVEGARTGYIETHHDGSFIYGTIATTQQLFGLDLITGKPWHVQLSGLPGGLSFAPNEHFVAVITRDNPIVDVVHVRLGAPLGKQSFDLSHLGVETLRGVAVTPDNQAIYISADDRVIVMTPAGEILKEFEVGGTPGRIIMATMSAHDHDDHGHDHDHGHGHRSSTQRLLVGDHVQNTVKVIDLGDGDLLETFSFDGSPRIYATGSGRYGVVTVPATNSIRFLDSGAWIEPHGDHTHLHNDAPRLLDFTLTGGRPADTAAHDDQVAIFLDTDGGAWIVDEHHLEHTSPTAAKVSTGGPHHGVVLPFGNRVLITTLNPATDTGPTGVSVLDLQGNLLETVWDCARAHGGAISGMTAAIGCADGVLLFHRTADGTVTSQKILSPAGSPAGGRVSYLVGHDHLPFFVGNFGRGTLNRIDPVAGTISPFALPADYLSIALDRDGKHLYVLTADGMLHLYEADEDQPEASVRVIDPVDLTVSGPRPAMVAGNGVLYLSDPTHGDIVEIHRHGHDLEIERRIHVGGQPVRLAFVGILDGDHDDHDHDH